ncbi:MAG: hypothetical protein RIB59_10990 [Rhodospirillales bacterium]
MSDPSEAALPATAPPAGPQQPQNWLFAKLSAATLGSFTEEQKRAIHGAVSESTTRPPVNIRMTIPLPGRRFYLTILSGQEQRGHERRRHERRRHPLRTAANVFFIFGFAVAFYIFAVMALALFSAVVEI